MQQPTTEILALFTMFEQRYPTPATDRAHALHLFAEAVAQRGANSILHEAELTAFQARRHHIAPKPMTTWLRDQTTN